LADPRSRSLVTNFAAQWLFLRDVETKEPDLYMFRDFDEGVRAAFVRETELFLDSILRQNRSVLDLMTADYTFLNEPLAKHYGIPNITGSHFRRVTLPKESPRRGLLGQGSVLSITSYSTRTSAVLRGKYVLENLLASPPPPSSTARRQPAGRRSSSKPISKLRTAPSWNGCVPSSRRGWPSTPFSRWQPGPRPSSAPSSPATSPATPTAPTSTTR
jgi:hypothetical protein